jgi:hypothetical protein
MEVSEIRRRLRASMEAAKRDAQERRARSDKAAQEYEQFLTERAVPLFQTVSSALAAEGHRFKIFTPADSVRLASESSGEDYIEIALDTSADPPVVIGRTSRGRGRRQISSERPVNGDVPIADLTDEDVLAFLLAELTPFLER